MALLIIFLHLNAENVISFNYFKKGAKKDLVESSEYVRNVLNFWIDLQKNLKSAASDFFEEKIQNVR